MCVPDCFSKPVNCNDKQRDEWNVSKLVCKKSLQSFWEGTEKLLLKLWSCGSALIRIYSSFWLNDLTRSEWSQRLPGSVIWARFGKLWFMIRFPRTNWLSGKKWVCKFLGMYRCRGNASCLLGVRKLLHQQVRPTLFFWTVAEIIIPSAVLSVVWYFSNICSI